MNEKRENDARPRPWPVLARPPRQCTSALPAMFGQPDQRCALRAGHADPHTLDPGRPEALQWTDMAGGVRVDETPETFVPPVVEVRPGDALIICIPEDYEVNPDIVREWTEYLREKLPDNVNVAFLAGGRVIVVRGGQS